MSNKCDEILNKLYDEAYVNGIDSDRGLPRNELDIIQAKQSLLQLLLEEMPKKKQVRYENNARKMGIDGKIITTETSVTYNQEEYGYNQALSNCIAKIREVLK